MRDLTEEQQSYLSGLIARDTRTEYLTLSDRELGDIINDCITGLCTTNGDTAPVTLTERQVAILLRSFLVTDSQP